MVPNTTLDRSILDFLDFSTATLKDTPEGRQQGMTDFKKLESLGWSPYFQGQLTELESQSDDSAKWLIGRIVAEKPSLYVVRTFIGDQPLELWADVSGSWRYHSSGREDFPSIGDWVAVEKHEVDSSADANGTRASVRHLFARMSCLRRKAAGDGERMQIIASNVDKAFIVTSLNADLNLRRVERYVALVWDSGAKPVVVLSKADLNKEESTTIADVERTVPGIEVIRLSAKSGEGIEDLLSTMLPGQSFVVIGSSGVGKSTLVNRLMGQDVMSTGEIREDDAKGRHTTTGRHLFVLPNGAILIDTPGMRELGLWDADGGVGALFQDIEDLSIQCKFTNCTHEKEPGCAIRTALEKGDVDKDRVASWQKLLKEVAHQLRKTDKGEAAKQKERSKTFKKTLRARVKNKAKN